MKSSPLLAVYFLTFCLEASAVDVQWTNTSGGSWHDPLNWSPNFVPTSTNNVFITNVGTYTVTITNSVPVTIFNLGGATGTQTLVIDNVAVLGVTNGANVFAGGILLMSNCWMNGTLNVKPGGELQMLGGGGKVFYSLNLINEGTVTWGGGTISVGSFPVTTISNGGLWQITGNDSLYNGGGTGSSTPSWVNSGILRKTGGGGQTFVTGMYFANQPSGLVEALSGTLMLSAALTNSFIGSFSATSPGALTFYGGIWTDAGGTVSGSGVAQFTGTTLYLRTNLVPGLKLASGDIYLSSTFQQSGAITNLTLDGATLHGTNTVANGTFTMNSGGIERVIVQPTGQLIFDTAGSKLLYNGSVFNQGTVTLAGGSLGVGNTIISNGGLWQITGDYGINYGGYNTPGWLNVGTLRKTAGSGIAQVVGINFTNLPGALVESLSGSLRFSGGLASEVGGTFNANAPALIEIGSGTWTDAGGVMTGSGTNRLAGGTFNLRTNTVPGLRLLGGDLYITGTNIFQQAGTITNLTLDGSVLHGTNLVSGALTNNNSTMLDVLTILPGGKLVLAGQGKNLYGASIYNQGTVLWTGGSMNVGGSPGTIISNGGLWQVAGDFALSYGGGSTPFWTNNGTLEKTAGVGSLQLNGPVFVDLPGSIVQSDSGILQLAPATTNTVGTLRLNGGTVTGISPFVLSGGLLTGTGSAGVTAITGGTVSPGQGGAGLLSFTTGLNLGSNALLTVDSTGAQYDQLSVTGAVSLGNCTLQISSLPPSLPTTVFTLINNDGTDPITGTFNGLPENTLMNIGGFPFHLHYTGGTGNDVTLVRADAPDKLTGSGVSNGNWYFVGLGNPQDIYSVQASTNFVNWTTMGYTTGDVSGVFYFHETNTFGFHYRFYRAVK